MRVQVHFSHLLISGLLAFSIASSGWPGRALGTGASRDGLLFGLAAGLWLLIISLTVLLQELGQGLALRAFGYEPTVHLIGIGGRTFVTPATPLPWHQTARAALAGPGLGLTAAAASFGLRALTTAPSLAYFVFDNFAEANLWWAMFNLLPLPPLAGGRVLHALATRLFGPPGFLVSQGLSLAFAAAVALFGLVVLPKPLGTMVALLASMFGFRSVAMLAAYRRSGGAAGQPVQPGHEEDFAKAEVLYQAGKLEEARTLLARLGEADLAPALRSKVHLLSGWIEVKSGKGRAALDHFSQVQGMSVAPQAIAAAFSLIGDDERALPLWIDAAGGGELTLRAELAGCLIRLGREADARKLPELRYAQALLAAERVYFLRGEYAKAAQAAEAAFQEEPNAELAYDAACGYARASDPEGALRMLQLASQNGFAKPEVVEADTDLESLRGHPGFVSWLEGLRQKASERGPGEAAALTKG